MNLSGGRGRQRKHQREDDTVPATEEEEGWPGAIGAPGGKSLVFPIEATIGASMVTYPSVSQGTPPSIAKLPLAPITSSHRCTHMMAKANLEQLLPTPLLPPDGLMNRPNGHQHEKARSKFTTFVFSVYI